MSLRLVLISAILSCAAPVNGDSKFCLDAADGASVCSTTESPDGETLSKLIQSIMAVDVNRTGLLRMTPTKFYAPVPPADGPFEPNQKLEINSQKEFKFLSGPETIAKQDNFLYAATSDGIYEVDLTSGEHRIVYDGNAGCSKEDPCSRPLGFRIKGNRILCADSARGLVEVNVTTGESKVHFAEGTPLNGAPVRYANDIDVDWERQIVYFSTVSSKWTSIYGILALIESDITSRVIRFNLNTGKAEVFAENIRFANGVQLSHDKKSLLVDEHVARHVLKYPLDDTLPVSGKPFTELLPGNPDNIRPSLTGGYWVALNLGRTNGTRNLVDEFQARPDLTERFGNAVLTFGGLLESTGTLISNSALRGFGYQVKTGRILQRVLPSITMAVELDADGKVLQSLQSTTTGEVTTILEYEGGLYCGSFSNNFVLSVPRTNFRC